MENGDVKKEEIGNVKYIKDFVAWHEIKSVTEKRDVHNILIQEGAVWLMRLGVNVGSELDGKGDEFLRPVIVVKKINEQVFFGVPASSKMTDGYFRQKFTLLGEPRMAVLSHVRSFDKKRCMRFMMMLDKNTMDVITQRIGHIFIPESIPESRNPGHHNVASGESPLPIEGPSVNTV